MTETDSFARASESKMRADAERNRESIIRVVRDTSSPGSAPSLRTVARKAGVSPATLYRHFGNKQRLMQEAFPPPSPSCQDVIRLGLDAPDPWDGFVEAFTRLVQLRTVQPQPGTANVSSADALASRQDDVRLVGALLQRARASGRLRDDVTLDDLILALTTVLRAPGSSSGQRADRAIRLARFVVRSFDADPTAAPTGARP